MNIEIPRPNLDDHEMWARLPVIHQKWMRGILPEMGIDVSKAVVGDALSTIIGDDGNCFFPEAVDFDPEWSVDGKRNLLIRLEFEIGTEELPEIIRQRLETVKDRVQKLDWTSKAEYRIARRAWKRDARDFVETQIELSADLMLSLHYFEDEVSPEITEPWQIFLYGKTRALLFKIISKNRKRKCLAFTCDLWFMPS